MKKIISSLLILALVTGLTACGSSPNSSSATTSQTSSKAVVENTGSKEEKNSDTALPQGTGVTLTVYSNSASDGRGDWLMERAAKDGFKIQYVHAGAAETQARLIAEKNAPVADVAYGLNSISWESLVTEDILLPYVPAWADEVYKGLNNPDGYYHAIVKQAISLVYDKKQWSADEGPDDWLSLWKDKKFWKTYQYSINLAGGTTRVVLASILTRYADPKGDLGISEEGWKEIAAYYEHGISEEKGVDLYAQIANPDSPVKSGQMWSSGIDARDKEYKTETAFVVPDVGVPFAVEGVAIIKGTKNVEEAKRFVDWFGSAQIQGEWAEKFSTLPANDKARQKANEFNQKIAALPVQEIDWKFVADNIDTWCEKIELTYMK